MKDLLEAGVHFGHQTKRWNPKMKPFIFGERSGIYIIDLGKTVKLFKEAEDFVRQLAAEGKTVLFVGTKRQAQDVIAEEAARSGMYYVNERWLGGLLTNFTTIQRSIARLRDLEAMATDGRYEFMPKKEIARAEKEKRKLQKNLEGIRNMGRLPDALFVVDTRKEKIAVDEARKLKIPVVGVVDTNCDPEEVDFAIPGNDDALRVDPAVCGAHGRRGARWPRRTRIGDGRSGDGRSRSGGRRRRPAAPCGPPTCAARSARAKPQSRRRKHGDGPLFAVRLDLGRRFSYSRGLYRPDRTSSDRTSGHSSRPVSTSARHRSSADRRADDGDYGGTGEATARQDRRGDDGLQDGADRSRRRHGEGGRDPAQEGARLGRQARRAAPPRTASSATTSTWAARSACSSR